MKRPSFQFYPGDWSSDLKLRRCSPAARGVWVDILCALHDSDDPYGTLRWPLKEIARTVGASLAHVRELVDKGVLRGSDTAIDETLVYRPRSGRKDGAAVTLIAAQPGPLWYSKRLVIDEHVRRHAGASTRFGASGADKPDTTPGEKTTSDTSLRQAPYRPPKPPPNHSPNPRQGEDQSDGSSSSSSSSSSKSKSEYSGGTERARVPTDDDDGPSPTAAGAICRSMRQAGLAAVNPGDPRLLELLRQGATAAEFAGIAAEAVGKGKGFAWVLHVLQARRGDAAAIALAPPPAVDPLAWAATRSGVIDRANRLGVLDEPPNDPRNPAAWDRYRAAVLAEDERQRQGAPA